MIFNPKEIALTLPLLDYAESHPNSGLKFDWDSGESYIARLVDSYETENMEDESGPNYREFNCVVFEITDIITDGPHRYDKYLSIGYLNFPNRITDTTTGATVYPSPHTRQAD